MDVPLEILFHNVDRSDAIEAEIRKRVAKLEELAEHIVSCRVTVDAPHKHHRQGNLFTVTVDVRMPGGEVVVSRDAGANHAHEDPYVAIRDAFKAARRQVQDYARVQRGKTKAHEVPAHGKIVTLHPTEDYGIIGTLDGREIYFHRNCVVDAEFDSLKTGVEVRFTEEAGDEGPQATTVHVIGKHHIAG